MAKKKTANGKQAATKGTKKTVAKGTKKAASEGPTKKKAAKRELIDTGRDKRFVRRDEAGRFEDVVDVGKSLSQDRRTKAKRVAPPGQGDKGDRKS